MSLISRLYRLFTGEPAVVKSTGAGTQADPAIPHVIVEATQVEWSDVQNKPTAFIPEDHTHTWATIADKPLTFPPDTHGHDWAAITNKPTTFPSTPEIQGLGSSQFLIAETRPDTRPGGAPLQAGDIWLNKTKNTLYTYQAPFWIGPPILFFCDNSFYSSNDRNSLTATFSLPTGLLLKSVRVEFITYGNNAIDHWISIVPRLATGDIYQGESLAPTLFNASNDLFDTNRPPAATLEKSHERLGLA